MSRNRYRHLSPTLASLLIVLFVAGLCLADVRLPSVIGDNMVIQQNKPVTIWGWANPGEEVNVGVSWRSVKWAVKASKDGKWSFKMAPPAAGGPYSITLTASNTVEIKNILVGEVWVCSGQSNMQFSVNGTMNAKEEIAAAKYPKIRLFTVPRKVADTPQVDCDGKWVECSPETVPGFTAVGYFFGRDLYRELNVPIGLIHTSWGGTPAESWTTAEYMKTDDDFKPILDRQVANEKNYPEAEKKYQQTLEKWKADVAAAKADGKEPPKKPKGPSAPLNSHSPSALYNAMIAPLIPYSIEGAIWYQGESNAGRAYQYRKLFPSMIQSWRKQWGIGDFPFLFVQLANFMAVKDQPGDSAWAELREAQTMTLRLRNTGMAVIIDIGEANNIHPKDKQDVGKRLALWALGTTYGRKIVYSGPLFKSSKVDGDKMVISFDHVGTGLMAKGGEPLKGFAIAGADKKFVWADAKIVGDTVVVSAKGIDKPVAVRYAWADNPVCNLYNKENLPASPFRTDDWPGVTVGKN